MTGAACRTHTYSRGWQGEMAWRLCVLLSLSVGQLLREPGTKLCRALHHMHADTHCACSYVTSPIPIPTLQGHKPSLALACGPPGLMGVSMLAPILSLCHSHITLCVKYHTPVHITLGMLQQTAWEGLVGVEQRFTPRHCCCAIPTATHDEVVNDAPHHSATAAVGWPESHMPPVRLPAAWLCSCV